MFSLDELEGCSDTDNEDLLSSDILETDVVSCTRPLPLFMSPPCLSGLLIFIPDDLSAKGERGGGWTCGCAPSPAPRANGEGDREIYPEGGGGGGDRDRFRATSGPPCGALSTPLDTGRPFKKLKLSLAS